MEAQKSLKANAYLEKRGTELWIETIARYFLRVQTWNMFETYMLSIPAVSYAIRASCTATSVSEVSKFSSE